jgi:predicted alpha-1,2-mannosidase
VPTLCGLSLLLLATTSQAQTNIRIQDGSTAIITNGASISTNFTVTPGAQALVVVFANGKNGVVPPATLGWGTQTISNIVSGITFGAGRQVTIYSLFNPTPGTHTITAATGDLGTAMQVYTLTNVNTSIAPLVASNYNNSTSSSSAVTVAGVASNSWAVLASLETQSNGSVTNQASSGATVNVQQQSTSTLMNATVCMGYASNLDSGSDTFTAYGNTTTKIMILAAIYTPAPLAPMIASQPRNAVVDTNNPGSVAFSVTAVGAQPLYYQWFTNGTVALTNNANRTGSTSNNLTIPNATLADLGNYTAVVTNSYGAVTSSVATLTLTAPAVVTNAPATEIQDTAAMLNGQVLVTGGDVPGVTLYYGATDGGTNALAWSNSVALGPQGGPFAFQAAGLSTNTTYYFTAKAVNSVGISWAVPSKSFATLPTSPPLTAYVNPFIGTAPSPLSHYGFSFDTGDVFPGAAYPLGMCQFSPDTTSGQAGGYWYPDASIIGFSTRHFSGRGIRCYQDFSFKPFLGQVTVSPQTNNSFYWSGFSHVNESASPGYYSVLLDNGVQVELTATLRTGMARFTFPSTNAATLLIDAGSTVGGTTANTSVSVVGTNQIQGYATGHIGGGSENYTIYFVAKFDRGFSNPGTWNGSTVNPGTLSSTGSQVGAFITFDATVNPVVQANVGISFVSIGNALANLNAENSNWDFALIRSAADTAWNNVLHKIVISGGAVAQLQTFYTALYHCFLHPNIVNDVNGQYMGMDGQVHALANGRSQYENIDSWGSYRSAIPLRAFLSPNGASDIAQSLVNYAQQGGGGLPSWEQTYRNSENMGGDDVTISVAGAYALGATNFDTAAALAAMKLGAGTVGTTSDGLPVRSSLGQYISFGYVTNQASTTLTYCGDDFALYQFSQMIGDTDPSDLTYLQRSGNWRNLFNSTNNLIQPRNSDGTWVAGVTPSTQTGYTESSAIQYTWMAPFNLKGLFTAMGGNSNVVLILDNYFQQLNVGPNSQYMYIGNEPCECDPWEYDYAGAPWGTQSTVRRILTQCFTNTPSGLPGNDDEGDLSSWYVFAALGFYPETPSAGGFVIGSPLFPSATINFENGRQIVIQGINASVQNCYVQSLTMNGTNSTSLWLPFAAIRNGATLVFNLTNAPSNWGTAASDAPPSFDDDPYLSAPLAPSGLSAIAGLAQINVSWNSSAGASSYNLKRSTVSGVEMTITNVTGTNYADAGLINGTTYYYVASAANTNGESVNSSEVSATPVAYPIQQLRMAFTNSPTIDGGTTIAASDTSGGGLNLTMSMFTNGTVLGDLHGASGTGVTVLDPNARALDLTTNTSPVWAVASYAGGNSIPEPVISVTNSTTLTNLGLNGIVTSFTVTFWMKEAVLYTNGGSGSSPRMWNFATGAAGGSVGSAPNQMGLILQGSTGNILRFYFGNYGNPVLNGTTATPLVANQWYFVAVTYDGQTFNMYLGTDVGSATLIGSTPLSGASINLAASGVASLVIGNQGVLNRGFNGWMEDFRIYRLAGDSNFVEGVRASEVVQSPPPAPYITRVTADGTSLSLSATNGAASGPWILLQSTNLALPLSQWQTNCMGNFDSSGNLSTNLLNAATNGREFYILKVR